MRGDEIEFFAEIGQWNARMNSRDHAADIEQFGDASEQRVFVGIETESLVTEKAADVKEIPGATSEIQNAERWSAIELEILGALHVDANPVGCVFVRVNLSRIRSVGITFAQVCEFCAVKCRQDSPGTHRMNPTASVFPKALQPVASKELLEFPRKSHPATMPRSVQKTSRWTLKAGYRVGSGQ